MSWHRQHMQWTREMGRNLLIEVSNLQCVVSNKASNLIINRQFLNYKLSQTWEPSHEKLMTVIDRRWAIINKRSRHAEYHSCSNNVNMQSDSIIYGGGTQPSSQRGLNVGNISICFWFEIHDFIQNTHNSVRTMTLHPTQRRIEFKPSSKTMVIFINLPQCCCGGFQRIGLLWNCPRKQGHWYRYAYQGKKIMYALHVLHSLCEKKCILKYTE